MKNLKTLAQEATVFLLGAAISAVGVLGALGADPFVSENTKQISKEYKVSDAPCHSR